MTHFENDAPKEATDSRLAHRPLLPAMKNGMKGRCPNCGRGALYERYLKVHDTCKTCGEALHHQRADDAPAYFTIAIIGKVIVGLFVWLELAYTPPFWLHAVIFLPLTLILSLSTLPLIKGALIGLQWANYMHGFDPNYVEGSDIEPEPQAPGDTRTA